jgi:putative ABC transport system permease protein
MPQIRDAIRNLIRTRAFSLLVVLTLALGIGATTAMFTVIDAALLTPLPFPNADRLVEVWTYYQEGASRAPSSPSALVTALRGEDRLFETVSGYQLGNGTLTGTAEPANLSVAGIAHNVFTIFPTAPVVGRLFETADANDGNAILISERLWKKHFTLDPDVIGRLATIDDVPRRIVGVLPSRFNFPGNDYDVWRPLDIDNAAMRDRVFLVALRRPGVTDAQIDQRLAVLSSALLEAGVLPNGQYLRRQTPIQVQVGQASTRTLYLLFGAVSVLLLVACVNASNLLLVRAAREHARFSLMAAIGANRSRLFGDAIAQSVILAIAGGALGMWVAAALLRVIVAVTPDQGLALMRNNQQVDGRALAFAFGVSLITCVAFGLLPAWRSSRVDPIDALKRRSGSSGNDRWQALLVSTQIALVVVLLSGAGLLLRSFIQLNTVDLGFNPDGIATLYVQLTSPRYAAPGRGLAIMQDVERRVETELGMAGSIMTSAPIRPGGAFVDVSPEAEGLPTAAGTVSTLHATRVSPDFFGVFQIPLIEGRTFEPADGDAVVIVNDVVARRFWGETSPIGRRFRVNANLPWQTVVGVAKDIKTGGPDDRRSEGMEIYQPFAANGRYNFLTIAVAGGSRAAEVLPQLKKILWDVDPKVPVLEAHLLSEQVYTILARPRFILSLSAAFAIGALVISAIGVYAVASYWVASRRREFGIRLAIGASPARLLRAVVGRSLRLSAIGSIAGLAIVAAGARVIESFLFDIEPHDTVTLIAVTIALGIIAILACIGPALSAARVDPMTTLRAE